MNIELSSIGQHFPSRYKMDEEVYFHPAIENLTLAEANAYAIPAKIVGVAFSDCKVTYDLALMTPNHDGSFAYYEALPARCVDSIMVKSREDVAVQDVSRPAAVDFLPAGEVRALARDFKAVASAVEALTGAMTVQVATASATDYHTEAYAAFAAAINARPAQHEQV